MPDWRAIVRARLSSAGLSPTTEIDVTEELAQHLDDRYRQLCAEGVSDDEAAARSQTEIDGQDFLAALTESCKHD